MNPYKNKKEKLKESLNFQILSGNLKTGDRIPSERLLGQMNNLSRVTVRNALAELEKEGIIEKRGRKGIFVCGKPVPPSPVNVKDKPHRIFICFFPQSAGRTGCEYRFFQ
ncbi:MAG: GntR family transcriptional regulator [Victivallales bacterium]